MTTKLQRKDLDEPIKWEGVLNVRTVKDGTPWAKWFIAGLALAIAVIVGAEIIFHLIAWRHQ